jgi:general secretion pathway protein C
VESIEWNRVVFAEGASRCELRMFAGAVGNGPAAAVVASSEVGSKVQKVTATEFTVDRQLVDRQLVDPGAWMKIARVIPDLNGGTPVIRLFGIRPDSLLAALGIENGDGLQTRSGLHLTSPAEALEAFNRLKNENRLILQLNRHGRVIDLDYEIK